MSEARFWSAAPLCVADVAAIFAVGGGWGRLPVIEGVEIRLAHQLPGKPAEGHTPLTNHHSGDSSDLNIRTITSWDGGQVHRKLLMRLYD